MLSLSLVPRHRFLTSKSSEPPSMIAVTILNQNKRKLRFRSGKCLAAHRVGTKCRTRIWTLVYSSNKPIPFSHLLFSVTVPEKVCTPWGSPTSDSPSWPVRELAFYPPDFKFISQVTPSLVYPTCSCYITHAAIKRITDLLQYNDQVTT